MFLVIAKQGGRQWVSGVFRLRRDADSYLQQVPHGLRDGQQLRHFQLDELPVYVTETHDGFDLMTKDDAAVLLASLDRKPDDEWCYLTLYRLDGDWRASEPGSDCMGILPHVHIENWHLDRFAASGLDALF